ncbi:hypothetical protein ACHAXT_001035 [Thalassiosira profunda]
MKGFFRTRKKSDADQDGVVDTARKVSIDHTMLSRDEHAGLVAASGDFSRSSDADSRGGEIYHPSTISAPHASNDRLRIVAPAPAPPNNMTASRSDPSFLAQYPDGYCHHQAVVSPRDLSHSLRSNSHPMQPPAQLPTSQQLASHKARDPALQARIEAIRIQQQLLGDNHPDVIFALSSLGKLQQRRGNHAEAASILSEARMRSQLANSAPQLSSLGGASPHSGQRESPVPTEISFSH